MHRTVYALAQPERCLICALQHEQGNARPSKLGSHSEPLVQVVSVMQGEEHLGQGKLLAHPRTRFDQVWPAG